MAETIRQITNNDIKAITDLFLGEKTEEELKWVLQNPNESGLFDGFLVENDNGQVIGMIGYEQGTYLYGEQKFLGSIFLSWKLAENYKGFAGVNLLNKALKLGEFGLAIQGSNEAKKLYSSFKLHQVASVQIFVKTFNPLKYLMSLEHPNLLRRLGNFAIVFPSFFKSYKLKSNRIDINEVSIDEIVEGIPYHRTDYFEKYISKNYLQWMASCPIHNSFIFEINHDSKFYGYCLGFIQKKYKTAPRARIVYLPNLGSDDEAYIEVLSQIINYLKQKKCCSVSIMSSIEPLTKGLTQLGFVNYKSKQRPVFIRDIKTKLSEVNLKKWYVQYTEGDKAYRGI